MFPKWNRSLTFTWFYLSRFKFLPMNLRLKYFLVKFVFFPPSKAAVSLSPLTCLLLSSSWNCVEVVQLHYLGDCGSSSFISARHSFCNGSRKKRKKPSALRIMMWITCTGELYGFNYVSTLCFPNNFNPQQHRSAALTLTSRLPAKICPFLLSRWSC